MIFLYDSRTVWKSRPKQCRGGRIIIRDLFPSDHKSESGSQQDQHQERSEASEASASVIVAVPGTDPRAAPHAVYRMGSVMQSHEAGAHSAHRTGTVHRTGAAHRAVIVHWAGAESAVMSHMVEAVSHHCIYLRINPCFLVFPAAKKDFCRSLTAKVLLSHLVRTTVGMTVAKYALALSYSLLRYHSSTVKCARQ